MAKYLDLTGLIRFWNSFKARLLPSGGSSGQVLAKASGTDYDVEWITLTNGDSLAYGVTTQPSAGTARVGATTV